MTEVSQEPQKSEAQVQRQNRLERIKSRVSPAATKISSFIQAGLGVGNKETGKSTQAESTEDKILKAIVATPLEYIQTPDAQLPTPDQLQVSTKYFQKKTLGIKTLDNIGKSAEVGRQLTDAESDELTVLKKTAPLLLFDPDTGEKLSPNSVRALELARREKQRANERYLKSREQAFIDKYPIQNGEQVPIIPGEKFSPTAELARIRTLPREEQQKALQEYKKKLAYQQRGLAKFREQLVEDISVDPDANEAYVDRVILAFAERFGFDDIQLGKIGEIVAQYREKHNRIVEARRQHPDNKALFKAIMGFEPQGELSVQVYPMSFEFILPNSADFNHARLWSGSNAEQEELNDLSGGFKLTYTPNESFNGLVMVAREKDLRVALHEHQHVINELFLSTQKSLARESEERNKAEVKDAPPEKRIQLFERMLRFSRDIRLVQVQDEVIAYVTDKNMTAEDVTKTLVDHKLYRAIKEVNEVQLWVYTHETGLPLDQVNRSVNKVLGDEYDVIVQAQTAAYQRLRDHGYTQEEAFGILSDTHITKWNKTVDRLFAQQQQQPVPFPQATPLSKAA